MNGQTRWKASLVFWRRRLGGITRIETCGRRGRGRRSGLVGPVAEEAVDDEEDDDDVGKNLWKFLFILVS